MPRDNTRAMKSPIPSPPATSVSSSCVWGRLSTANHSSLQARAKHLETQMFYGPGFDPPVNNALVPSIFNKLDAQCQERTRVINNVLDKRRDVQERVISRNRDTQARAHAKQTAKLKEDLRKITKRLPSFAKLYKNTDMALLEKQVKEFPVTYSRFGVNLPDEHHYCFRYFEHHNPVRIARRVAEGLKKDVKKLEQAMENKTLPPDVPVPVTEKVQSVPEITETAETAETVPLAELVANITMASSASLPLEPIAEVSASVSPTSDLDNKSIASAHSSES